MLDAGHTHARMGACTRRIAPVSAGIQASGLNATGASPAAWCMPSPSARLTRIKHLVSALVPADLASTRLEWEHAYRDLEEVARDPAAADRVRSQLEAVTAELRRRVGGTFTMGELVDEYARADVWARHVLAENGVPGWPRTLTLVEGAAFHLYARGAIDYLP